MDCVRERGKEQRRADLFHEGELGHGGLELGETANVLEHGRLPVIEGKQERMFLTKKNKTLYAFGVRSNQNDDLTMIPQVKDTKDAGAKGVPHAGSGEAGTEKAAGAGAEEEPPSLASADSAALSSHETDVHGGSPRSSAAEQTATLSRTLTREQEEQIKMLELQLAQLKKEEQCLQQKTWKANKMECKLIDAKILSLQARIKGHTKKIDKARAVADIAQTDDFEHRLAARERGELEGTVEPQPDPAGAEDMSRIYLRGSSLIFLEVDGTVSAMAGGIQVCESQCVRVSTCMCVCMRYRRL